MRLGGQRAAHLDHTAWTHEQGRRRDVLASVRHGNGRTVAADLHARRRATADEEPQPAGPARHRQHHFGSWRQQRLRHHVRSARRSSDAVRPGVDVAHRRGRPEGRLHGLVELEAERHVAQLAMAALAQLRERRCPFRRRAAARTDQVPGQLEHACDHAFQADREYLAEGINSQILHNLADDGDIDQPDEWIG